jgi:hypothetical protein
MIHLTNHQVQKNSEMYNKTDIPESQWSLQTFREHLLRITGNPNYWEHILKPKIKNLVIQTILAWSARGGHRRCSFELLGFDIMLTADMKPYLLEVNTNPGLHLVTDVVRPHHRSAIEDLIKGANPIISTFHLTTNQTVVLDNREHWEYQAKNVSDANNSHFGKWNLIYMGDSTPDMSIRNQPSHHKDALKEALMKGCGPFHFVQENNKSVLEETKDEL